MKGKLTKKIKGTTERPRLSVHRSLNNIYAQIIDDDKGVTIASSSTASLKSQKKARNNVESAKKVGEDIAKKAISAGVKKVVFDRGGTLYHGKISALADAARGAGLEF